MSVRKPSQVLACSLFALLCAGGAAAAQSGTTPAAKKMPFALPYDAQTLDYGQRPSLSASGRRIAYVVHKDPPVTTGGGRLMPNGVPASVPDSRIVVSQVAGGPSIRIGKGAGNCWRPVFSPDEQFIASYCDGDGAPHLWLHDLRKATSRRLGDVHAKVTLWIGDEPAWSPDGREIFIPVAIPEAQAPQPADERAKARAAGRASVTVRSTDRKDTSQGADEARAENQAKICRELCAGIGAVDRDTGAFREIVAPGATPRPSYSLLSPSGRWLSYLSAPAYKSLEDKTLRMDLAVVDSKGGPIATVAEGLERSENPSAYIVGASVWHPTRDQLFWVKDGRLWTAEAGTNWKAGIVTGSPEDVIPNAIAFTPDGREVVVGVDPLPAPIYPELHPAAFAAISLADGTSRRFKMPEGMLSRGLIKSQRNVLWRPKNSLFAARARNQETGLLEIIGFDGPVGRSVWRGDASVEIADVARDNDSLIVTYEDVSTPEDLYRIRGDFSNRSRISMVEPRLEGFSFPEPILFSTDVQRLDAPTRGLRSALYLPPGAKKGEKLPTIVFVYPRSSPNTGAFGGGLPQTLPASVFTTRGYAVMLTEMPIRSFGTVSPSVVDDIAQLLKPQIDHAVATGYVDGDRLAVSGQSFGGYTTASLLASTDLFRAGMALAGVYDLTFLYSFMNEKGEYGYPPGAIDQYWNMAGNPWTDRDRYIRVSPFFNADKIKSPLLIAHGTADMAPIADAAKMFNALRLLGKKAVYLEYEGEGHVPSLWSVANAADLAERAVTFLDENLKPAKE